MKYRLITPLTVIPVGSKDPITLPIGTEIERDDFRQVVGLTEVFLRGKRLTVTAQDLERSAVPLSEAG